jgi:peptide chain release factor subunit 3
MNPFVKDFVPNFGAQPPPPPRQQPPPPPPPAEPAEEEAWDAEPEAPAAPAAAPEPAPAPAPEPEPEPEPAASAPAVEEVAAAVEKVEIVDDAGADADESKLMEVYRKINEEDPRSHLNIVFIGHVDAGKSTLGGQILFLTVGVGRRWAALGGALQVAAAAAAVAGAGAGELFSLAAGLLRRR